MDVPSALFDVAKILLAEPDGDRTAKVILHKVLEATGASRGFIVVREDGSYQQRFDVRYDREELSGEARRFSRSLVREAITRNEILCSLDIEADPRLGEMESIIALGAHAVAAAPLSHEGETFGVVYVEHESRTGFGADELSFLREFATLAALSLKRASERDALERRARSLERDLLSQHDFGGIVTRHPKMLEALRVVGQVADSTATVLVRGETGTGKELVATALHVNSGRKNKPLVALHCTALPGTVLESELFGHVRGAFTGADRDRAGRIASAHGGTLFLDEIAEVPLEVQAKLLRFLQFGEIQRLGSDRTERVDVRIVAATHRDLAELVREGRFRQDLYYRLKVIELLVPPLRDRRSDIPLLIEHFLARHWRRAGETPVLTKRFEQALLTYAWPGNVRELAHVIEGACLLARSASLDLDLAPPEIASSVPAEGARPDGDAMFSSFGRAELDAARELAVTDVERRYLAGLMAKSEGNVSLASRTSGIHRSQLQKMLARFRG